MLEVPAPAPPADVARRLLNEAANRGEAIVSVARALFCGLVLLRFFAIGGFSSPGGTLRGLIEIPTLGIGIALSLWLLGSLRQRRIGPRALIWLTLFDALICFASLLSTVLWPDLVYTGLLRSPDPAATIAVVFVTALRLTPAAAWSGTLFNVGLLLALVALDLTRNAARASYGASEVAMLVLFTGSAGAVAAVACTIARRMVLRAGEEAAGLARARWKFGVLLREHHDVRTLLSSARLRSDLLLRSGEGRPHAEALARDLEELTGVIEQVKVHALGELAALDGATPVDVGMALHRCAEQVRGRFSSVEISLPAVADAKARVMGGERGLAHVLTNLLVNACEGDGVRRASRIRVELEHEPSGERVRLRVVDDGPGFRRGVLDGHRPRGGTTKVDGSGLGMLLVATLVEASGGEFRAGNGAAGGAQVEIALPGVR